VNENLRFVHQPAERLAMKNAISVSLKAGADFVFWLGNLSARAFAR
jgi:hypothetical protein